MTAREMVRTLTLAWNAVLPPTGGEAEPAREGEVKRCEPWQVRKGMGLFLDPRGELRLFVPDCRPAAAPFVLFRLKRQGYSGCRVEADGRGLMILARR